MRAHYFQHVPFEGLGSMALWLERAGYTVTSTQFFESDDLPDPGDLDFLVVMGGPMSVNEEKEFPWLVQEKCFIRDLIHRGTPVLGICLGAQLIANAMGAPVYPNGVKEIGWFPIQGLSDSEASGFPFPPEIEVFHWHGETFDLPDGAVLLAQSPVCQNQAFQLGKGVMGLQFHLETTAETARELVSHCRDELIPSGYVQTEEAILSAGPEVYRNMNLLLDNLLTFLTGKK